MKSLSYIALVLFLLALPSQAASIQFDSQSEYILVTNTELGTVVTVPSATIAQVKAAKTDGNADGDGTFEIRVFFRTQDETSIKTASNENTIPGATLTVTKAQATSNVSISTRYARLQQKDNQTGGLGRLSGDETTSGNNVNTSFSLKSLKPTDTLTTLVVFSIDNASTFSGDFKFIINITSNTLTTNGSLDGKTNGGSSDSGSSNASSFEEDLIFIVNGEKLASQFLNFEIACGMSKSNGELPIIDVCSDDGFTSFQANLKEAKDSVKSSKKTMKTFGKKIGKKFRSKDVTRKQAQTILKHLSCAFKNDSQALKRIKKGMKLRNTVSSRDKLLIEDINIRIEESVRKLNTAYEDCKVKLAESLLEAGLITEEVKNKFVPKLDDFKP